MRVPQAFDLSALSDPDTFKALWCKATWLGDRQELRRDHCVMQKLLRLTSNAGSITDARPALDLTLELFMVHADIEKQLPGIVPPMHAIDYARTLIELLNETPDDDPLFAVRASNVMHQLAILIEVEKDSYEESTRTRQRGTLSDELLQQRERLLRDAEMLIGATGSSMPGTTILN